MKYLSKKVITITMIITFFILVDYIKEKFYIFDPETLQSIAKEAIQKHPNSTKELIKNIVKKLENKYYGHINTIEVFFNFNFLKKYFI